MTNLTQFAAVENELTRSENKTQFQRVLCVWLRLSLTLSSSDIARAIGWKPSSVRSVQARFKREGVQCFSRRSKGGRKRENMSFDREAKILYKFARRARKGRVLDVRQIKQAYELSIGKAVPWSTIYRLIARHGLRHLLIKRRRV